ncbi:MAG: response regulator, partial [Gammaproteobacteria bacterium]|nr:response regulator [Gammaproteobacteria bacterium]
MADGKAALSERLATLQQDYILRLPDRLAGIDSIWRGLTGEAWEQESLRELHRSVHSLTGSGLTFGHQDISDAARAFESLLKDAITSATRPAASSVDDMVTAMKRLRSAIEAVTSTSTSVSSAAPASNSPQTPETQKTLPMLYLVEDDASVQQLLRTQIEPYGYSVQCFESLAKAMESIRRKRPVAVISDVNLPDSVIDAERAYATMRDASLPVIMISGQDDIETRLKAVRAGAAAFLCKPINLDELMDHVDRLANPVEEEAFRVLVVEDSPALGQFYTAVLREAGILVELIDDPMQAWTAIERLMPDLILMDIYMPGCTGLELASVIRQQSSYVSIPIVFLSSESNNSKQFKALGLGADDFLTKPIDAERLVHSVTTRAARARTLRAGMLHDSLTGLLNHSTVIDRLGAEISRASRQKIPLVTALVDIDHFKSVNDTYGHLMGDQVLRSLTRVLRPRLRKSDLLGRYGGEEFMLVLPDTSMESALRLVNELRVLFSQAQHRSEDREFSVTFSAGVAA